MTKPSVAIVTPSFSPMIGGIENYILGVGRELVALGHKIYVLTPDSVLGTRIPVQREHVQGMEVHRVRVALDFSYRIKLWPGLVNELRSCSPELIHVYSHDSYALLALLAARTSETPMLLTTYGPFQSNADYGMVQSGVFRIYDAVVSPTLFRGSDLVMMRYPGIASWLVSMGVSRKNLRLEPSGIPLRSTGVRDGSNFRRRYGLEGPVVLYLGRVSPQKGIEFAVKGMKAVSVKYPQARLVIIGPDYTGHSAELKSLAKALGLDHSIMILPPMTDEEAQLEALAACDVFVMPSSFEGFSQAVMKAMAQGKPVVVTNVGGLPFEIGDGTCGVLCPYGDPDALARGVIGLLDHPDSAVAMGTEGKARARLFTFDVLARAMSDTYVGLEA